MIMTMNFEFVSEVVDADDCSNAQENDESQKQLAANERRQLAAKMFVTY